MITLENRFFPLRSAICFLVEGGIIFVSVLASFAVLERTNATGVLNFEDAIVRGFVVAFFCQSCMYMLDLYDLRQSQSRGEIFFSLIFAIGFVCIGIGLVSYIVPGFGVAGDMYYLTILFVAVFLLMWRVAFDFFLSRIASRENILILGTAEVARMVAKEIKARERLGFHLVGFVTPKQSDGIKPNPIGKILGNYPELEKLVKDHEVRRVVVAISERRGEYPIREMLDIRVAGCKVVEWPDFFESLSGRIPIDDLSPSYFIFSKGFRKSPLLLFSRRLISALVATVALIILLPLLLVVAIIIIIFDSPGPVFYSQDRIGQNNKIFRIYKFRSMKPDAEKNGEAQWAKNDDLRITRVGRFLRLWRIDELPQVYNILRGDINLVGPRPERPEFVNELEKIIPYYSLRHTVKPGLTGWAQVMFPYSATIEESKEKLQYDLFYIKNLSLKLDLLIIFSTIKIVILGRGAR